MKNAWPIGITLFFVVFAGGLAVFVRAALRQPEHLVRADYYEHEITYQQHINRELEAADIPVAQLARFEPGTGLLVTLPPDAAEGKINLYRPSDAALDRTIPYQPGPDGRHLVPAAEFQAGAWRARLDWKQAGRACYKELLFQAAP